MAAPFVALGLKAANPVINNYDKVTDPVMAKAKELPNRIRSARGRDDRDDDYDEYDRYDYRRRDSGRGDRSRGADYEYIDEKYERRGSGRAKSAGRDGYGGRGLRDDRRDDRRQRSRRSYSSSSSESSISPRRAYKHRKSLGEQALAALGLGGVLGSEHEKDKRERRRDSDRYRRDDRDRGYSDSKRVPAGYLGYNERQDYRPDGANAGAVATRNGYNDNQSAVSKRTGDFQNARGEKRKSSSPSSSSSSDVCSSSEDERRQKKMKGKEFLTAGLAAVATIHAAHGVYSSMEARDKRHAEVAKGEMSPEEAQRLRRKAHLQDAAAIGIAALGIKGAYSEWQEVQEHRKELAAEKQEQIKRHEKREKKRSKYSGSSYGDRRGNDGRYRSEPDLNRGYREQGR
ncbi:MAG: hypothetical protein LQ350_003190 [Teloschistes chrysophthalmus]|nr:MAG: hypothetical protein LQ350_003190 [Niorma chrysophthalma]